MQISFEEAVRLFEMLPPQSRFSTLHPEFVKIDSLREKHAEPIFFGAQHSDYVYYHGAIKLPIQGTKFYDLQSPYGYGGPIVIGDTKNFVAEIDREHTRWCRTNQIIVEFIRFHPMLDNYEYYYGDIFDDRNTVFVDLTGDINTGYRELTNRRLRVAKKNGVEVARVQCDEFIDAFIPMYEALMRRLSAEQQYFFPVQYYRQLANWEKTILLICYSKEKEPLAAGIFCICGENIEYHLGASNEKGRSDGAMYALIDYAARLGKENGGKVLYLGGGTDRASDNSLLFFKSGFSQMARPYYIGSKVHLPEVYKMWRNDWRCINGHEPDKVLFYRF